MFSFASRQCDLSQPRIMGILNVTPDSFSDGGQYVDAGIAVEHALKMLAEGAAMIDIGGESTRPGAAPLSVKDEAQRVIPVIQALRSQSDCIISIDTSKPEIMLAAAEAGADCINDVCALQKPGALLAAAKTGLPVCLMHMQGQPQQMQDKPHYDNVVTEVMTFLHARIDAAVEAGIDEDKLLIDPGFGFGKTLAHNLTLLNKLSTFNCFTQPLLVGLSRKTMIANMLGADIDCRLSASVTLAVLAAERGADIIRCHDVKATVDAMKVTQFVLEAQA